MGGKPCGSRADNPEPAGVTRDERQDTMTRLRRWRVPGLSRGGVLVVAILTFGFTRASLGAALAPVEYGIDRSNRSTQWTLAWPQEPNITPFLAAEYNKP